MQTEKFDPFVSEWISFSKNPNYNLIEKCLKLAQILEYGDLDISKYVEKINSIGNSLRMKISEVKNPTYLVSMLMSTCLMSLVFVEPRRIITILEIAFLM